MRSDSHRLALLRAQESDDRYGLPHCTDDDRPHSCDLSGSERAAVDAHPTSVAVHVTLPLGYCKAKGQVFPDEQDGVSDDLHSILKR